MTEREPPPLDDDDLAAIEARALALPCSWCHGTGLNDPPRPEADGEQGAGDRARLVAEIRRLRAELKSRS